MTQSPHHEIAQSRNEPACPRCGYDQRGPVATWKEQCPLQGTCSECGLVFNWSEVLMPEKFEPRWCVEFVPRKRSIPFAAARTFVRSFNPWQFWSRMKMSFPVVPSRLVSYSVILLVMCGCCHVVLQTSVAVIVRIQIAQNYATVQQAALGVHIASTKDFISAMQIAQRIAAMDFDEHEAVLSSLPEANRLDQTQFRALVEQMLGLPAVSLDASLQRFRSELAVFQAQTVIPPVISHSYFAAALEMIVSPFASSSRGFIQLADGTREPYPSPMQTYRRWSNWWWPGSYTQDVPDKFALQILTVAMLTISLPACFLLLPGSRRRAKVRWAHIYRIAIYGLVVVVFASLVGYFGMILTLAWPNRAVVFILTCVPLASWIALPVWWAVAIKRYLKMPHSAAIAGLMTLILALLMSPLLAYVFPQWIVRMILN